MINRGLGLLEVILPRGSGEAEGDVTVLPPGQRDPQGFWFPAQCDKPGDIFSVQQRRLQARQRDIQKRRRKPRVRAGAAPPTSPPAPPPDRAVPLPMPLAETAGARRGGAAGPLSSSVTHTLLTPPEDEAPHHAIQPRLGRVALVVDSGESSE